MRVLSRSRVSNTALDSVRVAAQPAAELPLSEPPSQATLEFLAWVASRPRTYAEAMELWQTSCPRSSVWENAIGDALIQVESSKGQAMARVTVSLTALGRLVLDGRA